MIVAIAALIGSVVLALLAGWVVPAVGMRMLMPTLEATAPRVRNYRGIGVPTGLGAVWLMWVVGVAFVGAVWVAKSIMLTLLPPPASDRAASVLGVFSEMGLGIAALGVLGTLVAGTFAFGLIDDVFASPREKGFRGHLGSLKRGRLTTGGLKVLGIGLLALAAGAELVVDREPISNGWAAVGAFLATWLLAALVIALAANLVNLMDLRPGRALKSYALIAAIALIAFAWPEGASAPESVASGVSSLPPAVVTGFTTLALAILVLGPVLAVWRFDLGERAMLGDAGANAAGALAGYLLASWLPLWGLATAAVILLALNLASERVSFSAVIEANGFLRWLDGLGRVHVDVGETTSDAATMPDDDRDGSATGTGKDG